MSGVMEKTLASLPRLLTQSIIGGSSSNNQNNRSPSQDVTQFIKTVERARTKTQENAVVSAEMSALKELLRRPDMGGLGVVRAAFAKALFCQVLGHDVSFLAIHAINLCQQGRGRDKRLGYLTACLLLHRNHDMATLMLATLHRDLHSSHMGDNCLALQAVPHLVSEIHVSAVLPEVLKKLNHNHSLVREKAVHSLHALYAVSPSQVWPSIPDLAQLLRSHDPGELIAAVSFCLRIWQVNKRDTEHLVPLGPALLHMLRQVQTRAFPASYSHRGVSLPWLQVSLIQLLGNLAGITDSEPSFIQELCINLEGLLERAKVGEPLGLALVVESVKAVAKLKDVPKSLLALCSRWVGALLGCERGKNKRSKSLCYLGLDMLAALARLWPAIAAQHQAVILHCLAETDPDIRSRTTSLLHAMATPTNASAVCNHLLKKAKEEPALESEILTMVSDVAEKFLSDLNPYILTYLKIFLNGSSLNASIREDLTQRVLTRLEIVYRSHMTDDKHDESMNSLVQSMLDQVLTEDSQEQGMLFTLQVLAHFPASCNFKAIQLADLLLPVLTKFFESDKRHNRLVLHPKDTISKVNHGSVKFSEWKCTCLQALKKIVLRGSMEVATVKTWAESLEKTSILTDYHARCHYEELFDLLNNPHDNSLRSNFMSEGDTSEIDLSLSFLDSLVVLNLKEGKENFMRQSKPLPVKDEEAFVPCSVDSLDMDASMASLSQVDGLQSSFTGAESSFYSTTFTTGKSRWRDDDSDEDSNDKEQYTHLNLNDHVASPLQPSEVGSDLFAGLENLTFGTKSNIWSEEPDNASSSFTIHPFGLPSKSKSQGSVLHSRRDVDPNNASCWLSQQILNDESGICNQAGCDNMMENSAASIYDQNQSANFISTVDSLTDSDPAEESDVSPS